MPKFKEGMHFYIMKDGAAVNGGIHKLLSLRKPKAPHSMEEIYDTTYAIDIDRDVFGYIILKPAYGNQIKVEIDEKKFDARPRDVQVTVAGKVVNKSKFRCSLSPYKSICFQKMDENDQPVGEKLEYVFQDRLQ